MVDPPAQIVTLMTLRADLIAASLAFSGDISPALTALNNL